MYTQHTRKCDLVRGWSLEMGPEGVKMSHLRSRLHLCLDKDTPPPALVSPPGHPLGLQGHLPWGASTLTCHHSGGWPSMMSQLNHVWSPQPSASLVKGTRMMGLAVGRWHPTKRQIQHNTQSLHAPLQLMAPQNVNLVKPTCCCATG